MLSAIVNGASLYSITCKKVKYSPIKIVIVKVMVALSRFFDSKQWWDQVTVSPEAKG